MRTRIGFDDVHGCTSAARGQGEGETLITGIARVEKLAWSMPGSGSEVNEIASSLR